MMKIMNQTEQCRKRIIRNLEKFKLIGKKTTNSELDKCEGQKSKNRSKAAKLA